MVTLMPPTSKDLRSNPKLIYGLRFVNLNLTLRVFLGHSGFPPSEKSTPSLFHLAVVLCSEVMHV